METVESSPVSAGPGSTVVEIGCLAVKDGPNQPLSSLTLVCMSSKPKSDVFQQESTLLY